jgi:hypothetical protein
VVLDPGPAACEQRKVGHDGGGVDDGGDSGHWRGADGHREALFLSERQRRRSQPAVRSGEELLLVSDAGRSDEVGV